MFISIKHLSKKANWTEKESGEPGLQKNKIDSCRRLKGKKLKFAFYSPLIIPMVFVFGISILETVLKMAMGKDVKWEIYNKKSS